MATEIVMPKLGLTMTEGLINNWLVKEGDTVAAGQPVLEISSEKLTSDVEAPSAGVILKIISQAGDTVPCKKVIAWIGEAGESIPGMETEEVSANKSESDKGAVDSEPDLLKKLWQQVPTLLEKVNRDVFLSLRWPARLLRKKDTIFP